MKQNILYTAKSTNRKRILYYLLFVLALQIFTQINVNAATYTVINTNDSGTGSLRQAIIDANATTADDTINFNISGCPNGVCTITLTGGELAINATSTADKLTITNSTGASNLLISGNNQSRVFYVEGNANLTLDGVTVTGGNGTGMTNTGFNGLGGGIMTESSTSILTLTNSTVSGNSANSQGGGIYNSSGTLTLTNSTISGNTASSNGGGGIFTIGTLTLTNSIVSGNTASNNSGGGIFNSANNTITLTNSTVSGNTGTFNGGGIFSNSGTLTLTNSTVSGNTASSNGGILNFTTLNLTNVTVTQNHSTDANCTTCAGGVFNVNNSTANLLNTIIAGNTVANAASSPDFYGAVSSTSSFNLIGNNQGTTGITNGTNNNQVGTNTNPLDARLAPLGNYGGTTQTHTLLSDSPAIDAGSDCVINLTCSSNNPPVALTTDQRGAGFPRKVGSAVDIGAVEVIPSYTVSTPAGQNINITPTSNLNLNFSNVMTAGNTVATVIPPDQLQPLPSGFTLFGSNLAYDITTSASFSGNITVTFAVPNVADSTTCDNLRSLHYENGAWTTDTNATPIYNAGTQVCTVAQTVTSLSPFAVARILGTTAAAVNVGGRVMTTSGRGIAKVRITIIDAEGNSRTTNTSAFGYYRFTDVAAGATYIISASGKRFTFDQSSQVINLNADNNDVNFVGYANIISPQGIKSGN